MLTNQGIAGARSLSPQDAGIDRQWDQKFPAYQGNYNCYDYATSGSQRIPQQHDLRPSHPGLMGGLPVQRRDCNGKVGDGGVFRIEEFISALKKDGCQLASTNPSDGIPREIPGHYLIAAVLDNRPARPDYHFFRRDWRVWSHKFSNCEVSRVDASGSIIVDPRTADLDYTRCTINGFRGERIYGVFVAFFHVPGSGFSRSAIQQGTSDG